MKDVTRKFLQLYGEKKIWYRVFVSIAAVVVFATTYMLILPCFTQEATTYCGKEAHTHTDDCYTVEKELVCGKEESKGHKHTDDCYKTEKVLVCTNKDENHEHTDSCYKEKKTLVCDQEESEGHTHTDSCYKEVKKLTCDKAEHEHTQECFVNPNEDKSTLTATADDFTATAEFDAGVFPEGTTMSIKLLDEKEQEKSEEALNDAIKDEKKSIVKKYVFDISFADKDGKEVEPDGTVNVTVEMSDKVKKDITLKESEVTWELVHIKDSGDTEVLTEEKTTDIKTNKNNSVKKVAFESDSFSEWGLVATTEAATTKTYTIFDEVKTPSSETLQGTAGQYYQPSKYPSYQSSIHEAGGFYNEIFLLVPITAQNVNQSWTPNTQEYVFGLSNYDVGYCGDYSSANDNPEGKVIYQQGTAIAGLSSMSDYQYVIDTANQYNPNKSSFKNTQSALAKLNTVIQHCYPFVSADELMNAAGITEEEKQYCDTATLISACQNVIWNIANGRAIDFNDVDIRNATGTGTDHSNEWKKYLDPQLNPLSDEEMYTNYGGVTEATTDQMKGPFTKIVNYLLGLEADTSTATELRTLSIDDVQVTKKVANSNGTYDVTVKITFDRTTDDQDVLYAILTDTSDNTLSNEYETVSTGSNTATVTFKNVTSVPDNIRVNITGYQKNTKSGYYYYMTSGTVWQSILGVSANRYATTKDTSSEVTNATSVSVQKKWSGDSTHPDSVTVTLYQTDANNKTVKYEASGVTNPVTLNDSNDWFYCWDGIPEMDDDGNKYTYTVKEDAVDGYKTTIAYPDDQTNKSLVVGTEEAATDTLSAVSGVKAGNSYYITSSKGVLVLKNGALAWESEDTVLKASDKSYAMWKFETSTGDSTGYYITNVGSASTYISRDTAYAIKAGTSKNTIYVKDNSIIYAQSSGYQYYFKDINTACIKNNTGNSSGALTITFKTLSSGTGTKDKTVTTGDLHAVITNTEVKKCNISIKKVDSTDNSKTLKDAEFELYKVNETGSVNVPTLDTTVKADQVGDTYTTGSDGTVAVSDLSVGGEYYLIESKSPDGYSTISAPIHFKITSDSAIEIVSGATGTYDVSGTTITVKDEKGVELPSTGGIGTTLYTMGGFALLGSALGIYLLRRRRYDF